MQLPSWRRRGWLIGGTAAGILLGFLGHDALARMAQRSNQTERRAELGRLAADPDTDAEAVWQRYRQFRDEFPNVATGDLQALRTQLKERRDRESALREQQRWSDLQSAEQRGTELPALLIQADQFLHDFPDGGRAGEVRRLREIYARRLDEQDIQVARDYSTRTPLDFPGRAERYHHYLDRHPAAGGFTQEATAALKAIARDSDRHDFRAVRDHFTANPGDVDELVVRCRGYLAAHPTGQFRDAARELLRWTERITTTGEYRVLLRGGEFDRSVARWLSRGPKLSVELEVAGVHYGPSTIATNRYDPEWNFEFPRPVRWKRGDAVRIRVTEHSWSKRVVLDISSGDGELLAMLLLTGDLCVDRNRLTFASDFAMPTLPPIE